MPSDLATHTRWDDLPCEQLRGAMRRRYIATDALMLAQVYFAAGDDVPEHSHPNEQITYVLSGALKFWIGRELQQELVIAAGEAVTIPGGVPHKALALEDTFELDIFNPPREDWLSGADSYIRG